MQLQRIRNVYDAPGPFVSLHLDISRDSEDAADQLAGRWTAVRHRLEHAEISAGLVDDIGDRVNENVRVPGEARRTIIATGDGVLFDEVQQGHSTWPESCEVAPLPDLSGWLTMADREVPFVLVLADRQGADVTAYHALAGNASERDQVQGRTFYITKVPQGDWAQKQFQQTAEDRWHETAREVAGSARSMVRRHPAQLVVVAGDVRMRTAIIEELSDLTVDVVGTEAGGRAEGASTEALRDAIDQTLAELQGSRDADLVERLEAARKRGEGSANGVPEVAEALARAQVQEVALDLGRLREDTLTPGEYDGLAVPAGALEESDLPADQVLLAAAVLTGADAAVLPAEVGGGGGAAALMRWNLDEARPDADETADGTNVPPEDRTGGEGR